MEGQVIPLVIKRSMRYVIMVFTHRVLYFVQVKVILDQERTRERDSSLSSLSLECVQYKMPHRIAIGSCSHPSLPQPLWPIISSRNPASFIWAGDAIYADTFKGLDWKSIGLRRDKDTKKWKFTFPPPSIHEDATPDVIRNWYKKQWEGQMEYRKFVEGWDSNGTSRPFVFGTIDDHDYGANNGDVTYRFRRESNLEFMDFLYSDVLNRYVPDVCESSTSIVRDNASVCGTPSNLQSSESNTRIRSKHNDPMYQRALHGKGVYGVQLFDFSRNVDTASIEIDQGIFWGRGYWVPEKEAMIDPDVTNTIDNSTRPTYSTTHSVAIFVLDVRSNKTPWPKKHHSTTSLPEFTDQISHDVPIEDFLGIEQWAWFKSALTNSHATINIIVSGLQIHPNRFPNDGNIIEEWSKFPQAQQLLYDTVLNSNVSSPLFVSGDVHMSQILRRDCIRSKDIVNDRWNMQSVIRPLIEVTTSGLTHSWGTSFSSQPKHHRWPLKYYSYFISRTFMTIAHYIAPWTDLIIRSTEDAKMEEEEGRGGGKVGKQFELGLNFAEFEFDFGDNHLDGYGDLRRTKGAVTVRIFGKEADVSPKLEMRWTFDQLSGNDVMPGMTASKNDFLSVNKERNINSNRTPSKEEWVCVPYRGLPPSFMVYASNLMMFVVFSILFFLPHATMLAFIMVLNRLWKFYRCSKSTGTK